MNTRKAKVKETEIDEIVTAKANDDSAWEKAVSVRHKPTALSLPKDLATRAAFLARLHHQASIEEWLMRIIQERVELEEAAFLGAKRELLAKPGA